MIKDIDFVGYEVIFPRNKKASEQLNYLKSLDKELIVVEHILDITEKQLTNQFLSEKLLDLREKYEYTIDGIIVSDNNIYERKDKNPENAFAFKMILSEQIAEAKVIDVLWTVSKDGLLKPRVKIEPVILGGTTINYATGFNAKFIVDNNIGLGAIIKIVRSGDVIPHIKEVSVGAQRPIMPKEEYIWNTTNVDILIKNTEDNMVIKIKKITKFFKDLQVEGLGEANIKKIIESESKPDTIAKILAMTEEDFKTVENFKEKMAKKVYTSIKSQIEKSSLSIIASASNIFGRGFGEKKIETILKSAPDIITSKYTLEEKIEIVKNIDSMASKTAKQFVEKIPEFIEFMEEAKLMSKLISKIDLEVDSDKSQHELYKKKIVMTGFRDKELSDKLKELGASIDEALTKKTDILIIKQEGDISEKVIKAQKYNITIITLEKFQEKYMK
jgi:NAD-dependent DNA ligase